MRTEDEIKNRILNELKKADEANKELKEIRRKKDYYKHDDLQEQFDDLYKYINGCHQNVYVLEWALGEREG